MALDATSERGSTHEELPDPRLKLRADGAVELTPLDYWQGSKLPVWIQCGIRDLFIFVMIHYNLWLVPVTALCYFLVQIGYGILVAALVALYLTSYLDGSHRTAHGRPWEALTTHPIWHTVARFLHVKVIRETPLPSDHVYIFGLHPHGINVLSRLVKYAGNWQTLFPNVDYRGLAASTMFYVPLGREHCLWVGGVDASRSTAEKLLKAGKSALVYPGGVPEIFLVDAHSKENVLVLKKRLGFIKLAIRSGADLVPVFVFGEKYLYSVWSPPKRVVAFFRKTLQIPLIFFWGRLLWMPKAPPSGKFFGAVYGKPLRVKRNDNPTDEELQAVHAQYMKEVERLFHQYKNDFGYDEDETVVIT